MWKKVSAAVVVVALVGAGGWWYMNSRSKSAAAKNQPQYVQAPVQRGNVQATISGTGPVASVNGVSVRSSQAGTVAQILAQDGDRVKSGQVVLKLSNDTLVSSLKQAQIDLSNNQASLESLMNPLDTAVRAQQIKLENARLTLQQRQQDVSNLTLGAPTGGIISSVSTTEGSNVATNALLVTIYNDASPTVVVSLSQQAAAGVRPGMQAKVDFPGFGTLNGTVTQSAGSATPTAGSKDANVPITIALPSEQGIRPGMVGTASLEVPGLSYLVQGTGSVKNEVTEVRAQLAATVDHLAVKEGTRVAAGDLIAKLTSDNLMIQLKQAENDVKTQEQNLTNLVDPAQDPSGQLQTLRNKVQQAQITLGSRQVDTDDLQVKAPVDGQISALTPRVGDRVTANQSLFRVADYGAMQLTISVDELDVAKVKLGQKAQITLDALPGKPYTGTVSKINPEGIFKNDIANFEVTVAIESPQGLMAGMNATVSIAVDSRQNVLWVPSQAVTVRQGKAFVQVLEAGKPVQKEVQAGLRAAQQMEIIGGLKEGDKVIVTTIKATAGTTTGFGPFGGGGGGGLDAPGGGTRQQGSGGTPATGGTSTQGGGSRP